MGTTATQTNDVATVAQNCKTLRKRANLTQAALALAAGCSTATIVNIEKGKGMPRKTTATAILSALRGAGVTP